MRRMERLVLDAIERHGPDALVLDDLWPYVNARRWCMNSASLYWPLMRLEDAGLITSRWQDGPYPRRRLYSLAK